MTGRKTFGDTRARMLHRRLDESVERQRTNHLALRKLGKKDSDETSRAKSCCYGWKSGMDASWSSPRDATLVSWWINILRARAEVSVSENTIARDFSTLVMCARVCVCVFYVINSKSVDIFSDEKMLVLPLCIFTSVMEVQTGYEFSSVRCVTFKLHGWDYTMGPNRLVTWASLCKYF